MNAAFSAGDCTSLLSRAEDRPVHRRLDNGLELFVLPVGRLPIAAVQLWYRVGGRDEGEDEQGLAHLFEHMMFRGTDGVGPEEFSRRIQAVGGRSNAYTTEDLTVYHEVLPAEHLELALELEADRMVNLALDRDMLETERRVVIEELRLSRENDPFGAAYVWYKELFFQHHPYRRDVIGTHESLEGLTIEDCRRFYSRHYRPENAVLVVAGGVNPETVFPLVERHFGPLAGIREESAETDDGPAVTPIHPEPSHTGLRRGTRTLPVDVPACGIGFHVPGASHEDYPALELIRELLTGGDDSRLSRRLLRESSTAVHVDTIFEPTIDPSAFAVFAVHLPSVRSARVERVLWEELERLARETVPADELDRARRRLLVRELFVRAGPEGAAGSVGRAVVVAGDPGPGARRLERLAALTVDDVRRVAGEWLVRENAVVGRIEPDKFRLTYFLYGLIRPLLGRDHGEQVTREEGPVQVLCEEDAGTPQSRVPGEPEAGRPAAGLAGAISDSPMPPLIRFQAESGLHSILVPDPSTPLVTLHLGFPVGRLHDPKGREGTASLIARAVTRAGAPAAEALGGGLDSSAWRESTVIRAHGLETDFEALLTILINTVAGEMPSRVAIGRARDRLRAEVRLDNRLPSPQGRKRLLELLYGEEDPRGRFAGWRSLGRVDRRETAERLAGRYGPDGAVLVVVGDVDPDRFHRAVQTVATQWTGRRAREALHHMPDEADAPPDPFGSPGTASIAVPQIHLVDQPGLTQSTILFGWPGIRRTDPEYEAFQIFNSIFGGGGFASRLMTAVRVEQGWTYGIRSWYRAGRAAGPVVIETAVRTEETAAAIDLITAEWRRILDHGVTEEEVGSSRAYLTGSDLLSIDTAGKLADRLVAARLAGLEQDFMTRHTVRLNRVTTEDARDTGNRFLGSVPRIVVVGDRNALETELTDYARILQ